MVFSNNATHPTKTKKPIMARPKGSKDTRPRKRRCDAPPLPPTSPVYRDARAAKSTEAPFGYTTRGLPRTKARTGELGKDGTNALARHLIDRGLISNVSELVVDRGGKPPILLDVDQVRSLAKFGPTYEEMAAHFKCSVDALSKYSGIIDEGRQQGRLMIRQKARLLAMEGNVPMLLHAAKHVLGERDEPARTNVAVAIGSNAPTLMSPETESRLSLLFLEICPEASEGSIVLDKSLEVA